MRNLWHSKEKTYSFQKQTVGRKKTDIPKEENDKKLWIQEWLYEVYEYLISKEYTKESSKVVE